MQGANLRLRKAPVAVMTARRSDDCPSPNAAVDVEPWRFPPYTTEQL